MFLNGLYYVPVSNYGDGDTYDIVRVRALKILKIISSVLMLVFIMYTYDLLIISLSSYSLGLVSVIWFKRTWELSYRKELIFVDFLCFVENKW